ncbi:cobalt-zinc-cadmium resistance protein CzcA [Mucilaginibacter lappiensis]|uniref:Cobalt-zinc-cadmium resistance protein CzcA n=1 Tax=Mucilaginibacter lappiensis TaxID=354630 RepID=A0ABR6PP34_9SPHI|nr:CusA/CzcA family heavy metal efflux RND transporter [Mucilaginibacter lappiensis]MBB6111505.1 cobalt-zinc-cadmium resistance protein CzcA [Mucilaginibacter lappiensis]SIR80407.1 cobalt-zinc-cadmium resistance protein CzcA [Mucilaginibacter lappiensis]
MFDHIIAFSIRNKVTIGIMTLLLVVAGIYSAANLPVDAQPDITNNQVQIITQAPNLGAQEVEQFITAPIELSMANIAGIVEKRSISRSGISVITIVFKDNIDIYWARQQVTAQLKEAESSIPTDLGQPMLAPITTGLGEIYQYVIHPQKGYEQKYTATDLRTIQDWLVRTQLAGTVGVAEVSGWGGFVKQYEVALDNDKLNSLGLTIPDVYTALQKNNENTGGSYIEQLNNAYFIRGLGQVKSLDDIKKIVVKNVKGTPVLIRDIAIVQFGSATRYGAVTRNGGGEVVAGVTLMLKGENFSQVIKNVKDRMVQIKKSLPEGVVIEPFIDRTELVDRAIGTVKRNLLEGALIVIFVLVLLLGNFRAGLVVASVIPLAMLFAFLMMRLFGVSGNLMSLGAIDFGLIVDGAVIIVESVVHHITSGQYQKNAIEKLSTEQMDTEVQNSAGKLMKSAAFGQIIILIVYLPLLSLIGIEGKMFRPMAQTVAFAILGAFILSLTYVPMASALFLSKKTVHKTNISDRIINFLQRIYQYALVAVLKVKMITVAVVFILFGLSIWTFSRMGGEFIPTLEEGDLTVEISMMQGTSLSEVVKTFGKAEKLLKDRFPEIKQAVTRIGSSEIPTDPMPIERGDMMLAMKPKADWKTAATRQEMTSKMEAVLEEIPGIHASISQPMQMRFNELMTGIRQDVAIKIYGEDLDVLADEAAKIAKEISTVKGVSQPYIEKVIGLPQIQVSYNRDRMAQYGLNISDVNVILKTAFAGNVAGVVFEGEKRFDMVVRMDRNLRENIANVENLLIPLPSGNKVPLNQVADISIKDAPAQISREDGKRRIYVGFNVEGRDVESTVTEIQNKLADRIKLPGGYYMTYGGQFQNLQAAKSRLAIAVPAALLFILVLLYVTFRSVKESLLIFTAVPLASMGGIAALLLRGMPFSISAGVGFIALFGVAVLNGIVLIGYFNQLKEEGMGNIYDRVLEGTKTRLRPVLMTASVASLGFLPMALSSSAGAEVQKPLATVVIGGLVTATFLTLFVLPCLYLLFNRKEVSKIKLPKAVIAILIIGILTIAGAPKANAQSNPPLTLDSAIAQALSQNLKVRSAGLSVDQARALQKSSVDLPKTELLLTQDPTSGGNIDNSIAITQNIAWPGLYKNQRKLLDQQTRLAESSGAVTRSDIIRQVRNAWYAYLLNREMLRVLDHQDSIYSGFVKKAEIRRKTGETSALEVISARNKYQEIQALRISTQADLRSNELALQQLLNMDKPANVSESTLPIWLDLRSDTANVAENPQVGLGLQQVEVARAKVAVEKSRLLPDFTLGYNQQLLIAGFNPANINRSYSPGTRIGGFQVGISVPVFSKAYTARIRSEKLASQVAEINYQQTRQQLRIQYEQELQQYQKFRQAVEYYTSGGLKQADEQLRIAQVSFNLGEIGYIEYIQNTSAAVQTRLAYLEAVSRLNQSAIQIQYIKGK